MAALETRRHGTRGPAAVVWSTTHVLSLVKSRSAKDSNGCLIWNGRLNNAGYPVLSHRVKGKVVTELMHRRAYTAAVGEIPVGLQIDHLCNVPRCVNVEHLEVVTGAENVRRRDARKAVSA